MNKDYIELHTFTKPQDAVSYKQTSQVALTNNDVRVLMQACPINPADLNYVQGNYGIQPDLPSTVGIEGAGIVIESNSPEFTMGDQVIFITRVGTWQTEIVCNPSALIKINKPIPPLQAAMLKVNPMTAWRLITAFADLEEGDYIIQNAANSGVGQCVIQLAKILGFKTINLVRREELIPSLKELGADIVLIDHKTNKDDILANIGESKLPKLALNAVGGDSALRLMDILAEQGQHVTYGAMSLRSLKVPNKFLIFKRICLHGLWITKDIEELPREHIEEIYAQLAAWVDEGKLHQAVDSTYRLNDFADAIEHAQQPGKNGKVLFQMSN